MPVVSDFVMIRGDSNVVIGDTANSSGWTKTFNTGGRRSNSNAYITFMVRGMTVTNQNAQVFVNDKKVGVIFNNKGGNQNQWNTQTVALLGSQLNNGNNTLRVEPVTNPSSTGGSFDDYVIRDVFCHFHQSA